MRELRDPVQHEKDILLRTHAENQIEVKLCERFFGHLVDGFNLIESPFKSEELPRTILLIATLGYDSLRWSLELLLKGYYGQANALARMAWESWLNESVHTRPLQSYADTLMPLELLEQGSGG